MIYLAAFARSIAIYTVIDLLIGVAVAYLFYDGDPVVILVTWAALVAMNIALSLRGAIRLTVNHFLFREKLIQGMERILKSQEVPGDYEYIADFQDLLRLVHNDENAPLKAKTAVSEMFGYGQAIQEFSLLAAILHQLRLEEAVRRHTLI